MGLGVDDGNEPSSTPKLYLSKLPCKPPRQHQEMLTPPLQASVAVPFRWEEVPGKPRATSASAMMTTTPPPAKYKSARCLDLPPRLLNETSAKITTMPSPTAVLDGPYMDRPMSSTCSFSFRRGQLSGIEEGLKSKRRNNVKEKVNFGSWRWGSFKEDGKSVRESTDLSASLRDILKNDKNVKITRITKRNNSFFSNFSSKKSNSWAGLFSGFKLPVPWRCRQETQPLRNESNIGKC